MEIRVTDYLGEKFAIEDAILLRSVISDNIGSDIVLDFDGVDRIPSTFLCCLFNDLIYAQGRDFIINHINVKNLSNYADYSRVVKGTTFN